MCLYIYTSTRYSGNDTWELAKIVYYESLKAPRNIFTKVTYNKKGEKIYDNNPNNDLKEDFNPNFSFEWLPKQNYDNLILGKYCNCCAHISGAGSGIMRASMILDCCQNLVIRNNSGEIIAKTTLYINKNKGYGVFNTIEISLNYRNNKDLENIYEAFLRGIKAFVKVYNQNNENNPIITITIGTNRNAISEYLKNKNHPVVDIFESLNYGNYSVTDSHYAGDWQYGQILILEENKNLKKHL